MEAESLGNFFLKGKERVGGNCVILCSCNSIHLRKHPKIYQALGFIVPDHILKRRVTVYPPFKEK